MTILLTVLYTFLSFFSFLSISSAYSDFDRVICNKKTVNYDKCDAGIILQHLVNSSIKNAWNVGNVDNNYVQTIFFVHDRFDQKPVLIAVTTTQEFFLITKEKTYYIEEHEISNLHANYKFVYYITDKVDMDFSNISLVDVEYTFQTLQL